MFRNHNGKRYQICQLGDLLLVLESSDHFFIQSVGTMVTQGKIQIHLLLPKVPVRRSNGTLLCEPYLNLERQCLSSVERYDPDADEWTKVADMTTRRSGAGVGVIDGLLYAVGGHDGPTVRKSAEVFHPQVRFI